MFACAIRIQTCHLPDSAVCLMFGFFTYLFVFPCFVFFFWFQMNICKYGNTLTHSQTETNSTCRPWRRLACSLPPSCQLVPVSVLDEWSWNESYLIWETHLVPSFLCLSSNRPPRSPPPSSTRLSPHRWLFVGPHWACSPVLCAVRV